MIVDADMSDKVSTAIRKVRNVLDRVGSSNTTCTGISSYAARHARVLAESAFYDPKMLALLYFPEDEKYAVYVPFLVSSCGLHSIRRSAQCTDVDGDCRSRPLWLLLVPYTRLAIQVPHFRKRTLMNSNPLLHKKILSEAPTNFLPRDKCAISLSLY